MNTIKKVIMTIAAPTPEVQGLSAGTPWQKAKQVIQQAQAH